ncbi:MAG TPA: hypothetical protein VI112_16245 [Bacteroidia bacterium]|jgi:hypothetical protein
MIEEIKEQLGMSETEARVKFRNGRVAYGVISNFITGDLFRKRIWFIPNNCAGDFRPAPAQLLNEDIVEAIDVYLK